MFKTDKPSDLCFSQNQSWDVAFDLNKDSGLVIKAGNVPVIQLPPCCRDAGSVDVLYSSQPAKTNRYSKNLNKAVPPSGVNAESSSCSQKLRFYNNVGHRDNEQGQVLVWRLKNDSKYNNTHPPSSWCLGQISYQQAPCILKGGQI